MSEKEQKIADSSKTIAELFNSYFASVFSNHQNTQNDQEGTEHENNEPNTEELERTISELEVLSALRALDPDKTLGPDGIPSRILKETAQQIAPSITLLFNKSMNSGVVPDEWKLANVVSVYKRGEKEDVQNYRPISLLCIVSKLLERCVLKHIWEHLCVILNECQHGFVPGKSCTSQLIGVLDKIGRLLDRGEQIDVIYLDMSKAFDRVNHKIFIEKLRHLGFKTNLLRWFKSYLYHRRQQVTVLGVTSPALPVTSGVPQGSILGPVLFLLYVNDLPDKISSSSIAAFADDTKIFKRISSITDNIHLQEDLNSLVQWSCSTDLTFNPTKCKVQTISRKRKPIKTSYTMGDSDLEHCSHEKDLGVWISYDLTWKKHVQTQSAKANKILGYAKRTTQRIGSVRTRRTIYLTVVRAHLAYSSQVWAPQTVELIKEIEQIQRRATKYILQLPYRCPDTYKERLIQTDLLPLSYWHEYLDMVLLFKLTNNTTYTEKGLLPTVKEPGRSTRSSSRVDGAIMLEEQLCRSSTYARSYLVRSKRVWNVLPKETRRNTTSLSSYKHLLKEYYQSALKSTYDSEDTRTWKSICVKCGSARSLLSLPMCCF